MSLSTSQILIHSGIFSTLTRAFAESVKNCCPHNQVIRFEIIAERVLKRLGIQSLNYNAWSEIDQIMYYLTEYSEFVDFFTAELQYFF